MSLQLYIGNKNYSSWSMRSWVMMRQLGIEFDEIGLRFDFSEGSVFRQAVARLSPAATVPVLVDDGFAVWDTLAIAEYLHEKFPALGIWPAAARDRARSRSLCAQMHAGFAALRGHCPMNIEAKMPEVGARLWAKHADLRSDVERIDRMWNERIAASAGPMLFGQFSGIDAYFAPVCSRIETYALAVSVVARDYAMRVNSLTSVRQWREAALQERCFVAADEPYRNEDRSVRVI